MVGIRPKTDAEDLADKAFGKDSAETTFELFRKEFGALVVPTLPQFARVDALGVTKIPPAAFFIECMARRCSKDKYPETLFDIGQLKAIEELHKSTGFQTYLVISFSDGVGYILLPDSRALTRVEGAKCYLDMRSVTWFRQCEIEPYQRSSAA